MSFQGAQKDSERERNSTGETIMALHLIAESDFP
jgi:hypothetical protein